ncbi:PemK-like, MazF-like toxin of type II toxin-antitoxin system [Thermopolyspora flexuosa]|uniref:PemK-like, MazF-like toxin of type II toxin-antitoxin system n=1 Tax=Thermopolyspora flexuosa TaxID=103836 RepID=A0A543J1I7_9ACTN|nr:PemK-like, MazF-like toxin of type II toxin-antitoxin system [Thermopolyspora flexuosa]
MPWGRAVSGVPAAPAATGVPGGPAVRFRRLPGVRDLNEDPRPVHGGVRQVYHVARAATIEYSPDLDGMADPGEIVWAWVPYEEDPDRGKDRPMLVVGRHGRRLLGMMLSSRGGDARDPEDWLELGTGPWDRQGRVSYLRLDRIYELDEDDIRREGAVLDRARFARVAAVLRRRHGWAADG